MARFTKSLEWADQHGLRAIPFHMSDAICLAHSLRWLIDQILDRPFDPKARPVALNPNLIKARAAAFKKAPKYFKKPAMGEMKETADRKRKANSLYQDLKKTDLREGDSTRTQSQIREHLSNKFDQKVEIEDMVPEGLSVKAGLEAVPRYLKSGGRCAYMISLRSESGVVKDDDFLHAVAAYVTPASISFFDPNMGEVMVAPTSFDDWFRVYESEWRNSKKMQKINKIYFYKVHSPGDLEKYVKSLKKAAAAKREALALELSKTVVLLLILVILILIFEWKAT